MMCSRVQRLLPLAGRHLARSFASPAVSVPPAYNEPMQSFPPGSRERAVVVEALDQLGREGPVEIPCVVGGEEVYTGNIQQQVSPYDHKRVIANFHYANQELIEKAIDCSLEAKAKWENMPFEHRAAIFLRAADLLSTKYRPKILATTMLGQAKTIIQAEVDASCESIDFLRFAVSYAAEIYKVQPQKHSTNVWNRTDYRALEGFIASISPFNFTAIGANLSATPTIMGNVLLWKPSDTAMLSNWTMFQVFQEAGLPSGVVNFVPADGPLFGDTVTQSRHLAAINFTGSARTFKYLFKAVGKNIDLYRTFPRLVGECGGKNYHFVHPSADIDSVVTATVRGAFEYGGQKCSAPSRMYVPESLWPEIKEKLVGITAQLKVGPPVDFTNFTSAVIDERAFDKISSYLDFAKSSDETTILAGGVADKTKGYFIQPTVIQTTNPKNKLMQEEIFGPVVAIYVYKDSECEEMLNTVNETSEYGLTGALFSKDREFIVKAMQVLKHSAGNFYVNDKSTGSVVGHQPFGGGRGSGTNDKAGAASYMLKWVSPMSIKETLVPQTEWSYPSIDPAITNH